MDSSPHKICDLNDRFRTGDQGIPGLVFVTVGVQELVDRTPDFDAPLLFEAVASFDSFTSDNDPHHEHDFGSFEFGGERLFWKIDYYAPDLQLGSEDPADIGKTIRVLTIMLASEY